MLMQQIHGQLYVMRNAAEKRAAAVDLHEFTLEWEEQLARYA
jgi:hypothetical protein